MVSQLLPKQKPKRRSPVFKKLQQALPVIRSQYGVKRIGIFGSFARGEQKRTSDVDVLVALDYDRITLGKFVALAEYLENLFSRRVDLLTEESLDKYIKTQVEHEVIWVEG
jgi:predicted nucleotidyltransferase